MKIGDASKSGEIDYSSWQLVKDVYHWVKPYKWRFWIGTALRLFSDIVALYFDFVLAILVTLFASYTIGDPTDEIWRTMFTWVLAGVVFITTHYLAKYNVNRVAEKSALDAGLATVKHMFKLDIAWHQQEDSGNKVKRILKAEEGVNRILRMWVNNVIEISVRFIGTTIVIAMFDINISFIMMIHICVFLMISIPITKKAAEAANIVNIGEEELAGITFESINNVRTVKVLDAGKRLAKMINKKINELNEKIIYRIYRFQTRGAILSSYNTIVGLSMYAFIVYGIIQGRYEIGFLVLFVSYYRRIRESVREMADISQEFSVAKYGVYRMKMILNEPVNIEKTTGKVALPKQWNNISAQDISFGYDNKDILKEISFSIKRGEKIGLVGPSGVGKSTLFKLLLKEYENFGGKLLFDKTPIRDIKKSSYFDHVAVVLQDTEVFNFTLKDNIVLSDNDNGIDEKRLERALSVAHVDDFLHKLPDGLDTLIGEKGFKLSGGERQRLGIARAVYKKPDILFLDEATSHLDVESEQKIQEALHDFFQEVTAVVIAHRLTTIKEMDRILVLEQGKIIEEGSFDELYSKKGRFFDLWEKQRL